MSIRREERKEWARHALRGLENALMPSFSADLTELDEEGIRWDVRTAIAHGFFSTMCAVETGLTLAEQKRFVEIACDEARGRILVSFTLLQDSFEDSLELLAHAERCGASHALLGYPPAFRPEKPEEIVAATRRLADAMRPTSSTSCAFIRARCPSRPMTRLPRSPTSSRSRSVSAIRP